MLWISFS